MGVADPLFMHELAETLHMPVSELGQRMSNAELCRDWPLYFAYKRREAKRQEKRGGQ